MRGKGCLMRPLRADSERLLLGSYWARRAQTEAAGQRHPRRRRSHDPGNQPNSPKKADLLLTAGPC